METPLPPWLPPQSAEQRSLVLALAANLRPMQHAPPCPVTRRKAALVFHSIDTASKPPSASSWRPMPRPTGGTPRRCCGQAYREWGRMRTRRATARSAVKVSGLCSCCRLGLGLGVRVEPFASNVATSAVALLVVRVGVVPLRGGQGRFAGGRRRTERGREREQRLLGRRKGVGVAVAAARLAVGLGATDATCSGAPGERGGGVQAGPRKVAPRKAEEQRLRLRRHSTMK